MPRIIFKAVAIAPKATPKRMPRCDAMFGTCMIHSANAGNRACMYCPNGMKPIITMNAETKSKVASRLRARNDRYAADAM